MKKKQIDTLIMVGDADAIQSGEVDQIAKKHTSITPVRTYGGIPLKTVDFTAPSQTQMAAVSAMTTHAVFTGKNVYICCGAGIGRSGTYVRAAVMDFLGVDEKVAHKVCEHYYPKTNLERECQEEALKQYAHKAAPMVPPRAHKVAPPVPPHKSVPSAPPLNHKVAPPVPPHKPVSPTSPLSHKVAPPVPPHKPVLPASPLNHKVASSVPSHTHKSVPSIPARTHTGVLPIPPQPNKAAPIAPPTPPKPVKSITPFIYWKDSGKKAAKGLKPGEFLIRESEQPGKLTINYKGQDGKLVSLRVGYAQGGWKLLNSKLSQSTEPVSILDISNPKFHAIFTQLLTEISAGLPNHKMVISTEKEAGLLNVYSAYYSSKTSIGAYTALHSGLQQYFSSNYDLSGQGEAKSDLADKHDELGQKLDTKGYGELLDFQLKGFANKEQNSKALVSMLGTLINKSNKMAVMPSTCSSALAFQPCHSGVNKPELTNHWAPPVA